MKLLDIGIDYVLEEEGGWSNVKGDKGGPTNFGITIGVFKGLGRDAAALGFCPDIDGDGDIDQEDLANITKDQAREIYRLKYDQMDDLGDCDMRIKIKHFDIGVNCGLSAANKILQRAVNRCFGNFLEVDGIIGQRTRAGISGCRQEFLLQALCDEQLAHYEAIVRHDPEQIKFLGTESKPKGWRKRAARKPELWYGVLD